MAARLFLGIDGGGSKCRARIRDETGKCIAEAEGGSANIYQDFDAALGTILATARRVAGKDDVSTLHAGLGLAGIMTPAGIARVRAASLPFATLAVESDAYIACLGAHAGGDGGIVIAGTGSVALALVGGKRHVIGGWGFALGDDGSGAAIGRGALRRAVLALDGFVPTSPLLDALLQQCGRDYDRLTAWARTARPRDYSQLAPQVFAAAKENDPHGRAIIEEAADAVALMARVLLKRGAPRLSFIGGLKDALRPYLPQDVASHIVPPRADPVDGAIMMARAAVGMEAVPS